MSHARAWNNNLPADEDLANLFPSVMRNMAVDVDDRLSLDHYNESSEDTTLGYADGHHKKVTMYNSIPASMNGSQILHSGLVSAKPELFALNSNGVDVQITENGKIKGIQQYSMADISLISNLSSVETSYLSRTIVIPGNGLKLVRFTVTPISTGMYGGWSMATQTNYAYPCTVPSLSIIGSDFSIPMSGWSVWNDIQSPWIFQYSNFHSFSGTFVTTSNYIGYQISTGFSSGSGYLSHPGLNLSGQYTLLQES